MPESPSSDAGSLSARAQEILRRADSQLAALRAPAPPPVALPEPEPEQVVPEPDPSRPPEVQDLGQLIDTVEAGIGAARAHLVALSASLERIAHEIAAATEQQRRTLPPMLADHARLPEELAVAHHDEPIAEIEVEPELEPVAEQPAPPPPRAAPTDAAHDAARLVAIEMAVAGDTREGVGRRLREDFGIRDPREILDDAFGPDPAAGGRRSSYGS
ncbi:MAG: hypothetical protein ACJ762_07495 [Solirubrobacteraceae bacterium]